MISMDLNPGITDVLEAFDCQQSSQDCDDPAFALANEADRINSTEVNIISGAAVDKMQIHANTSDVKYAYLISGEKVYDLKIDEGVLTASCRHGSIKETDNAILYFVMLDGSRTYSEASVNLISDALAD